MSSSIKVGRRTIEISREDKIIFPKDKITKGDVIDYYHRIAAIMVPHIKDRPLTVQRFPDGIGKEGFYQKDAPDYFPDWIERISISRETESGTTHYPLCNNAETLVYLANQLCLVYHIWLSSIPNLKYPDRLIFDLDPPAKVNFALVRWTAQEIKKVLEQVGLTVFLMTTGSRGVHVVVPLKRTHSYAEVKAFAYEVAHFLIDKHPDKLTVEMSKKKRGNRIFIDALRNAYGHHGVAPYSIRPKPGAPIATPIEWRELSTLQSSQKYTIKNIFRRLSRKKDPWHDIDRHAQTLTAAQKKLKALIKKEKE